MNLPFPQPPGGLPPIAVFIPVGSVIAFAGQIVLAPPVAPGQQPANTTVTESQGWMVCDGRTLNAGEYFALYAAIGKQYNNGKEGAGQFSIPDYRGYFLRMVDMGSGNDPDATSRKLENGSTSSGVGSIQQDALQLHQHQYQDPEADTVPGGNAAPAGVAAGTPELTGPPTNNMDASQNTVNTSIETRAKNVYVYYLLKFV